MRGIKRGARVVLLTGGPEMVIERVERIRGSPERYATCKWFDKLRVRTERFGVHVLELSQDDAWQREAEPARKPVDAGLPASGEQRAEASEADPDDSEVLLDDDDGESSIGEIIAARRRVIEMEKATALDGQAIGAEASGVPAPA